MPPQHASSLPTHLGAPLPALPEALARALSDTPVGAPVYVDGGHFTIRPTPWPVDAVIEGSEDTIYALLAPADIFVENEIDRIDRPGTGNEAWHVLKPPPSTRLLPLPGARRGWRVEFGPTKTQAASLHAALSVRDSLGAKGVRASITILVGDIPLVDPELRRVPRWFLPASYHRALNNYGALTSVLLLSEAQCRNVGKARVLAAAEHILEDPELQRRCYTERGFALVQNKEHRTLWIASDATRDLDEFPYAVAVLKERLRPTCGTILAGKFQLVAERGTALLVSCHDVADDPLIHRKNIDAAHIASTLLHQFVTKMVFWTMGPAEKVSVLQPRLLTEPGELSDIEALLVETGRLNATPGWGVADAQLCVDACATPRSRA